MGPASATPGPVAGPRSCATIPQAGSCSAQNVQTTNNRMELTAAVRGLSALKVACEVEIVTDSEYLKNGITQWIAKWKRNGWKTSTKQPVEESGPVGGAGKPGQPSQNPLDLDQGPRLPPGQQPRRRTGHARRARAVVVRMTVTAWLPMRRLLNQPGADGVAGRTIAIRVPCDRCRHGVIPNISGFRVWIGRAVDFRIVST